MRVARWVWCVFFLSFIACRPAQVQEGVASEPAKGVAEQDEGGQETSGEEGAQMPVEEVDPYAPTYGPVVETEALYLVEPVPGGKRLQAVLLRLDDGQEWIRAYRPVPDEFQFFEKRVVVKGRTYTPSPMVQHVMRTHFEVESIKLAPAEVPHDPVPTSLPPVPTVDSVAGIAARDLLWAQVQGSLDEITVDESNTSWCTARLTLRNGEQLELPGLSVSRTRTLVGKEVTVVGRSLNGTLSGRITLCEGHVTDCGVPAPRIKGRPVRRRKASD